MVATLTMLAEGGAGEDISIAIFIVIGIVSWIVKVVNTSAEERRNTEGGGEQTRDVDMRTVRAIDAPQAAPTLTRRRRQRPTAKPEDLDAELDIPAVPAPAPVDQPQARPERPDRASKPTVHLTAKTARQAIILHEILSPPKAMQQETAMWDR